MSSLFRILQIMERTRPKDVIGNMPDIVVTNILDRLPLLDAVRTGILSRSWRCKWTTMLSQLVFDKNFYDYLLRTNSQNSYGKIITSVLRQLRGTITKFDLTIVNLHIDGEYDNWFSLLSRKGTTDLTLRNIDGEPFYLPTHFFSCLELKHLKMDNCYYDVPPRCRVFPNLLSLELYSKFESSDLGDLFALCPLLEVLDMSFPKFIEYVKLVEIAKLENLKILSMSLCDLDPTITSSCTIFELVESLPKLEELDLDFTLCELTEVGAKKRFPTIFPGLKALKLSRINLDNDNMVSCFFEMVRSFPNLQTLEIATTEYFHTLRTYSLCSQFCSPEINTIGLLQLQNVVFKYQIPSENDVCLIKYLLACSPALKRIVIRPGYSSSDIHNKIMFALKLLNFQRASPIVQIDLY